MPELQLIVTKNFTFDAAHYLPNYTGKCKNLHGHTYHLEVSVRGNIDPISGFVLDFSILKEIVKSSILDQLDHNDLNKIISLPTAEKLCVYIVTKLIKTLPKEVELYRVKLWETPDSNCEVVFDNILNRSSSAIYN